MRETGRKRDKMTDSGDESASEGADLPMGVKK
jgi:hypothetical protein